MCKHDVDNLASKALKKEAGFTLIELLIVIAIIAILAAIAIPQFMKYKQGAYLDSARSDVKNAVTAIEAYQATYGVYPKFTGTALAAGPGVVTFTAASGGTGGAESFASNSTATINGDVNISPGNKLTFTNITTCTNGYTVSAYNVNITSTNIGGKDHPVSYNSCTGQYTNF